MTLELILRCQGRGGRCAMSFVRTASTPKDIRNAARAGGWSCAHNGSRDLCPLCTAARAAHGEEPAPGTCTRCHRGPVLEFRDSIGHDGLGHQVGNLLASQGITTWDKLNGLSMQTMFAIPGLGDGCISRIRWAQDHPKEDYPA